MSDISPCLPLNPLQPGANGGKRMEGLNKRIPSSNKRIPSSKSLQCLAFLALLMTFQSCARKPNPQLAEDLLRNKISEESNGEVILVDFFKTNGQNSNPFGVELYTMSFEASVEFQKDGVWRYKHWMGGEYSFRVDPKLEQPASGFLVGIVPGKNVSKGQTSRIIGQVVFELTEKGWIYSTGLDSFEIVTESTQGKVEISREINLSDHISNEFLKSSELASNWLELKLLSVENGVVRLLMCGGPPEIFSGLPNGFSLASLKAAVEQNSFSPLALQATAALAGVFERLEAIEGVKRVECAVCGPEDWSGPYEQLRRIKSNMRQMVLACASYASDNNGSYPPTLRTLWDQGYIDIEFGVEFDDCPSWIVWTDPVTGKRIGWNFFGESVNHVSFASNRGVIVFALSEPILLSGSSYRLVTYGNGSTEMIFEIEYQNRNK